MPSCKAASQPCVALVSMPWGSLIEPPLGVSILKSIVEAAGGQCTIVHAGLYLLRYVRYSTYRWLADSWGLNDFVFSREFEEQTDEEQLKALDRILRHGFGMVENYAAQVRSPDDKVRTVLRLRNEIVPSFFDVLMEEVDWEQFDLVGFSCLFDQTVPSLALAHRIKSHYPDKMIAFGGAAIGVDPTGPALQRSFPEIDVIAYGDGEAVILPLVEASMGRRSLAEVPNISYRAASGEVKESSLRVKIDLNDSPTPNYDDFFSQRERLREEFKVAIPVGEVPLESSRGCWWGERSHCTFCGIDDESLRYRAKSGRQTMRQLDELHSRYGVKRFLFTDYIMPLQNYVDLFPQLERRGGPYDLHYETKANLTEKKIAQCARAGVKGLQPGIESFSSAVLRRMDKGVSGSQNIFTVRTIMQHGMMCFYNLIWGLPGDTSEDYNSILRIMPALYHLLPPASAVPVMINRFAPLAEEPERFGRRGPLDCHPHYDVIFSKAFRRSRHLNMRDWVYYYDEASYRDFPSDLRGLYEVFQHQVLHWRDRFSKGKARLRVDEEEGGLVCVDTRASSSEKTYRFPVQHKVVYQALSRGVMGERQLRSLLKETVSERTMQTALAELSEARLVIYENGLYVAVGLPGSFYDGEASWVCGDSAGISSRFRNLNPHDPAETSQVWEHEPKTLKENEGSIALPIVY